MRKITHDVGGFAGVNVVVINGGDDSEVFDDGGQLHHEMCDLTGTGSARQQLQ